MPSRQRPVRRVVAENIDLKHSEDEYHVSARKEVACQTKCQKRAGRQIRNCKVENDQLKP
jgi:hypothetical protein